MHQLVSRLEALFMFMMECMLTTHSVVHHCSNGGHMIKFELYKNDNNYKCHFNQIGSFVVSIAHYMRAYFNYQAISKGKDFTLPGDAGYLNVSDALSYTAFCSFSLFMCARVSPCVFPPHQCVMLQETAYADNKLYAKVGCMDRQTFTSTKLQLHVYTDDQCSVKYDDGYSSKRHYNKGYEINGYTFSTKVSFRPPFYSCEECTPAYMSDTFNKKNTNWYDDDYISQNGQKHRDDDAGQANDNNEDDDNAGDDYYVDDQNDAYYAANDDVNGDDAVANDDANDDANAANDDGGGDDNNNNNDDDGGGDDYYNDDGGRMRRRELPELEAVPGQLEVSSSFVILVRRRPVRLFSSNDVFTFFWSLGISRGVLERGGRHTPITLRQLLRRGGLEHVPSNVQLRSLLQLGLPSPRLIPLRRVVQVRHFPAHVNVRVHDCHDGLDNRQASSVEAEGTHVWRRRRQAWPFALCHVGDLPHYLICHYRFGQAQVCK